MHGGCRGEIEMKTERDPCNSQLYRDPDGNSKNDVPDWSVKHR